MLKTSFASGIRFFHNISSILFPLFLIFSTISSPIAIEYNDHPNIIPYVDYPVHPLFKNTEWKDVKACGIYFNELKEFKKTAYCAENLVWKNFNFLKTLNIPRCYVITKASKDVNVTTDKVTNFVIFINLEYIGSIVGFYDNVTKTIFLIENTDLSDIYKHELQHYFVHYMEPETSGAGHEHLIWEKCYPKYYTPTIKAKIHASLLK